MKSPQGFKGDNLLISISPLSNSQIPSYRLNDGVIY